MKVFTTSGQLKQTGDITLLSSVSEDANVVAAAGATETLTDLTAQDITLDQACTFTFPSPTSGDLFSFTLILRQDGTGGFAVTWPASVDWEDGSAPTLVTTANSVSILTFYTIDGGTIWHGALGSSDSK